MAEKENNTPGRGRPPKTPPLPHVSQNPNITHIGKTEIVLLKDSYEKYKIGGRIGNPVFVSDELAEKMVKEGYAIIR